MAKTNKIILFISALALLIFSIYGYMKATQNYNSQRSHLYQTSIHYRVQPAQQISMKKLNYHAKIMKNPIHSNQSKSASMLFKQHMLQGNLVQINKKALASKKPTYIQIAQRDKTIGWVKANQLSSVSSYKLPYTYYSQFWPSPAKDACEIAALKTAMSTQAQAENVPLDTMVRRIPLSKNPNQGYTGDPYHYGTHATIYPKAMAKVARQYNATAYNVTGTSTNHMIYEITHGRAIVYEGPYLMKKPGSDHDLTIVGYKPGYFYVVDPFSQTSRIKKGTWVSIGRFNYLYKSKQREQHALIIG